MVLTDRQMDRSAQGVLRHTLSITTARSDEELLARALRAALDLTGAAVAVVIGPDGATRAHGDTRYADRLSDLDASALRTLCAMTTTLTRAGLGTPVVADFGDITVVLAARDGRPLRADAHSVLELVAEHARATRE